jgi:nanoRNase/pAp phosphatase (c-di-AMP/oligoRNAs hydrolase)
MNQEKLIKALDNENNEALFQYTTKQLRAMNANILKEIDLPHALQKEYMQKLKEYRYIDDMKDLHYGAFLRWIPLTDLDNLVLQTGATLCEIQVKDKRISLICKNFAHRYFRFNMDECLVFQKLSSQEQVLLCALDHLSK